MVRKRITIENYLKQPQEFGIDEYEDHVELGLLLSTQIERVDIPETINRKQITVICDDCFFNSAIKEVVIPGTVELIGAQAFALCKGLTEIVIPDSVIEIGHHAFRDCTGLKRVVLSKNLKRLPAGIFSFCYLDDPEVVLPEKLEVIESGAFWCGGQFPLFIPDSVKIIEIGAFHDGPNPVTMLPYDYGWFSEWPYGEKVIAGNMQGVISDIRYIEGECRILEVTSESGNDLLFYPCDFVEGKAVFMDEKNRERAEKDIKLKWGEENKHSDAYIVLDAWKKGLI